MHVMSNGVYEYFLCLYSTLFCILHFRCTLLFAPICHSNIHSISIQISKHTGPPICVIPIVNTQMMKWIYHTENSKNNTEPPICAIELQSCHKNSLSLSLSWEHKLRENLKNSNLVKLRTVSFCLVIRGWKRHYVVSFHHHMTGSTLKKKKNLFSVNFLIKRIFKWCHFKG